MGRGPMSHLHHVATVYKECSLVLHDGTPLIRTNPLIRPKCSICQSRQAIAGKDYSQARARLSTMYGGRKRRKVSAISHNSHISRSLQQTHRQLSCRHHPPSTKCLSHHPQHRVEVGMPWMRAGAIDLSTCSMAEPIPDARPISFRGGQHVLLFGGSRARDSLLVRGGHAEEGVAVICCLMCRCCSCNYYYCPVGRR